MKTIFKTIFFLVASVVYLTACNNDYDMPDPGAKINPEKEVAGTYVGEWLKVNEGTGAEEKGTGTLVFSPDEEGGSYVVSVTAQAEGLTLGLTTDTARANISKNSNNGYDFVNTVKTNGFGVAFLGGITNTFDVTLSYTVVQRKGLKEVVYNVTFKGNKQ